MKNKCNEKNDNAVKNLIATQVRKQIDIVLRELLSLEEELTVK